MARGTRLKRHVALVLLWPGLGHQMVAVDTRLERLDRAAAENERRIRELTAKAQTYTSRYGRQKLYDTLKAAEKLQYHKSNLFKIIERTEHKLSAIRGRRRNDSSRK